MLHVTLSPAWLGCTGFREPCRPGPGASGAWGQATQTSMPLCGRPGAVLPLQFPSKQGWVTMSPCEWLRGVPCGLMQQAWPVAWV